MWRAVKVENQSLIRTCEKKGFSLFSEFVIIYLYQPQKQAKRHRGEKYGEKSEF